MKNIKINKTNEKNIKNKKFIKIGSIALAAVLLVTSLSFGIYSIINKDEDKPNENSIVDTENTDKENYFNIYNGFDGEEELDDEIKDSVTKASKSDPTNYGVTDELKIEDISEYTGIKTNEKSLIYLVMSSISKTNKFMSSKLESKDQFDTILFKGLDTAINNKTLNTKPNWGEAGKEIVNLDQCGNFTYNDWVKVVGINIHNNYKDIQILDNSQEILYNMITNKFYKFDIAKLKNFYINGCKGQNYGNYEINYVVYFEHGSQKYKSLVGNIEGKYILLDILNAESFDTSKNETTKTEVKENIQNNVVETPKDYVGEDPYKDDSGKVNDPDSQKFNPENKDGYVYVPGEGYVKIENGGGSFGQEAMGGEDFWDIMNDPNNDQVGY